MSTKSGVKGKTVPALSRAMDATKRQAARAQRDPRAQLDLLASRPGAARRERAKLAALVAPAEPENVAHTANEAAKERARTRRRAVRKADNGVPHGA